ncbi:DMT transporter permease [Litoreibacter roseus]|uniref:DMT transporter permease n=2 Tax=Litoreibacter roseus TaxID=2601869 RepID=A0A6N6JD20_9RHOB|nr:DMT transporter permease [Litoreibacter roseus]
MLGAIVSFTAMAIAGRAISSELDTFELMLYRSLIGICIVLIAARLFGTLGSIQMRDLKTHALRNVAHFTGQNCWFAAITMIPLAQVVALEFTSPIWVALLAPFVLNEKLTRLRILVAVLGFIGILIAARPDISNIEPGIALAALAAVGFAGSALFTKLLTRSHSITNILFWLTVMQSVFGLVMAGWDGDIFWPSVVIWPWVVLVAFAGLCAHFCLTTALTLAPAAVVMPMDFARLPVIAVIGALAYSEALDPWVILGAVIIFSANYLNIAAETRRKSPVR